MSWQQYTGKRRMARRESVRTAVIVSHIPGRRIETLIFYIGRGICERLGWNTGMRIKVFYGEDADFGWVRLERCDTGGQVIRQTNRNSIGGSLSCRTGHFPPQAALSHYRTTECKFFVAPDDALHVKLPECFWQQQARAA